MIRQFDSIAALGAEALRVGAYTGAYGDKRNSWFGDETVALTQARLTTGDRTLVPDAEHLIDQLDAQIETPRRVWERAPVGAFCSVPDVLAGLPTPMRRQIETGDEHAPIAIIACSTISASVTTDTIRRRGTAILALTMALGRSRPISLHTVATTAGETGDRDETVLCTRIETAPLDLALACWTLTSPGFARRVNYGVAAKINGFQSGWPRRFRWGDQQPYLDYLRDALAPRLGVDPVRTLVIGPTHALDPLATDPVPWLNAQIARFTNQETDA